VVRKLAQMLLKAASMRILGVSCLLGGLLFGCGADPASVSSGSGGTAIQGTIMKVSK